MPPQETILEDPLVCLSDNSARRSLNARHLEVACAGGVHPERLFAVKEAQGMILGSIGTSR